MHAQFYGMPRRLRAEAEKTEAEKTEAPKTEAEVETKEIVLRDEETGIIVTVRIPVDTPKEAEEAVARAMLAVRRAGKRSAQKTDNGWDEVVAEMNARRRG